MNLRSETALRPLTLAELEAQAGAFDEAVLRTPDVDRFCSSSAWVLSAWEAFHSDEPTLLFEGSDGYVTLARGMTSSIGRYLAPLEAMWGLACPLVGPDPADLAVETAARLESLRHQWDALWLCGLPRGSTVFNTLVASFGRRYRLGLGPTARRHAADVSDGWDGFMSRRSSKFRANLRRALRKASKAGVTFEAVTEAPDARAADALYQRIMEVEARSWKGLSEQGIGHGGMFVFYRQMLRRLGPAGRIYALFARREGRDVGYLFGARFGEVFRGLQMSFDEAERDLSLGNVMQGETIRRIAELNLRTYDLGSDIPYKARWAESGIVTATLVVMK